MIYCLGYLVYMVVTLSWASNYHDGFHLPVLFFRFWSLVIEIHENQVQLHSPYLYAHNQLGNLSAELTEKKKFRFASPDQSCFPYRKSDFSSPQSQLQLQTEPSCSAL
jgi:hypothetical protein